MDLVAMNETSPLKNVPDAEEVNFSVESKGSSIFNTVSENNCVEEDDELKEVEEDLELLGLENGDVGDSILFKFRPKEFNSPLSSPRPSTTNRRYTLRPQKRPETTECNNFTSANNKKKCTSLPKNGCLETIFENPVLKNGSVTLLGKNRLKRYLSFDSFVSKAKRRHRKLKLKRLSKGKKKKSIYKVSVEDVKLKLKALEEDDEDAWMDVDSTSESVKDL